MLTYDNEYEQKKTNVEPRIKLSYNRNRVQAISLHTWWNIEQKTTEHVQMILSFT